MRSAIIALSAAALVILVPRVAMTADKPADKSGEKAAPVCPVMGRSIDKGVSIDYHGGKLYFCCPMCIKKFQDQTAKYATKANLQLVLTGQAKQTACPLMGKPMKDDKLLKVAGVEVKFCCEKCVAKVTKASPKEQLEMIFGKGFDKGYTVKTN